jgi:uncharacterized protein YhaN
LRFSLISALLVDKLNLIILDDPLQTLDPTNLKIAKELIKEKAKTMQVVYFTCHESRNLTT